MSLETATYLPDLVASNPAPSDPVANAADHMRLIKGVIKATFPNFTSEALQSTQDQIDGATLAVDTNGITILADAGVNFKTNTTDKITNPASGEIDIVCAGTIAARFMASSAVLAGTLTTSGLLGPGACPIGAMVMWLSDTLPSGFGTWAWANGQAISRTTYATLYGIVGTTWGPGDGATTFNLINMQEVVPIGKSTMGGATSPGLLASISAGLKAVLNGIFGTDTHTLTDAEIPAVPFSGTTGNDSPDHTHGYTAPSAPQTDIPGGTAGPSVPGTTGSNTSGASTRHQHAFSGAIQGGGGAHTNVQPSRAVNFIIRIA